MKRQEIVAFIKSERLIAIVRTKEQEKVPEIIEALVQGGIRVIEITSNTPGFLNEISKARERYATSKILIGAGTVTNKVIAEQTIKSGAQFLVTPNVNQKVLAIANQYDIPVAMGALTPTEICTAVDFGADIVKLFPAGNLGVKYFKSVKSPLDDVCIFAVGGIDFSNIEEWIAAGVSGFGLGSALTKAKYGEEVECVKINTERFVKIKKEAKWIH
ncbi:bifunctional 4-hydroxy-2-oxoglutarate aldolase/2-dehydro-3-deoxy-phosphogluconate aldolase [Winogradskyella sp. HB-48]|uniref:bifunctional 4-hydroxy-2-oxoglutarate aldolase/2-dehydro-3-deoxy-phosphogluconate aldolase n=1 Tax=Winogradskyella sp. HB-48 TaxID=3416808 RepID=UPI003CEFC2A7